MYVCMYCTCTVSSFTFEADAAPSWHRRMRRDRLMTSWVESRGVEGLNVLQSDDTGLWSFKIGKDLRVRLRSSGLKPRGSKAR